MTTNTKIAAQFAAKALRESLTTQLRDAFGATVSRKQLATFEEGHGLKVQWNARRDEPAQTFRTPLGFVRPASARGVYAIPPACDVHFSATDIRVETVELVNAEGGPLSAPENEAAAAGAYGLTQV
jgi:hypothetical protein